MKGAQTIGAGTENDPTQGGAGARVDKKLVARRFGRHAAEYDGYAEVQQVMAAGLAERVRRHHQGPAARIADIGCGTGGLAVRLWPLYPAAELTLLDLAPAMLHQAERKLRRHGCHGGQLSAVTADAEAWAAVQPEGGYDLIVSSAAFQWFNAPAATLRRLVHLLRPGGLLAFATFLPGTLHELHAAFRQADAEQGRAPRPRGQAYPSAADWHGWARAAAGPFLLWEEASCRCEYGSLPEMLAQVRRIGAGNALKEGASGMSPSLYRRMAQVYQERFGGPDGRIPATYAFVYALLRREQE
ncbi:methyltransferase domain-containing protein [Paenibacillus melissococcoides]|uniref:Malonyl-[acyl-carrier protein] O-methyltransferase n=1 Tax=Paenibacillus melissococcoides TaxID=2912268 RepID=A0ABM9GAV1_9BACL|nr:MULTISPECIES: methyltransferase domain-containing protein [Paenibacillus]GIO78956.1 malonyl-[acyl-carrier protein] O-methyltransferase [Paenibacillus dendritiformis]CAH8249087.1 methyltransferase domain-containing protein [Paenibacillus melissococcoides]